MKKSYFAILEVTSNATPDQVHAAYRRLAKAFHPDHYEGGSEPFKEIQEAYSVLGDPAKRKAYEKNLPDAPLKKTAHRAPYPEPEPLIPEQKPVHMGEISPIRSFETVTPSLDEVLDWLGDNFTNVSRRKSGRVQNLTLEVPLNREQARRGGRATIMVPSRLVCPTCGGYGEIGFYACHRCAGEGVVSGEVPISVTFPPGLLKDHSVVIPLDRFGIRNLYFTVLFRPMEVDCVGFSGYCIKHR